MTVSCCHLAVFVAMTVVCAICIRSITDDSALVQTKADCKHYYHDSCVKVRFSLPSKSYAAGKVANTCPVCVPDVSDILKKINARLDSVEKIDGMNKKLEKIDVDKINEISSKLEKIDKIGDIGVKMDTMASKVDSFEKSIASVEGMMDKLSLDYNSLKVSVKELQERLTAVENARPGVPADLAEEIKGAAQRVCDGSFELRTLQLESQLLADEITVGGLPEERGEKLMDVVMSFSAAVGVQVTGGDVVKLERLGRAGAASRNVRVKFSNQRFVDDIMKSVKVKPVELGAVMPAAQVPGAPVYVHRRHPSSLYKLRSDVRKAYPGIQAKNVWISYACVNVRYADDKPPVKLLPSTGVGPLRGLLD